jgi:hypothetical protein
MRPPGKCGKSAQPAAPIVRQIAMAEPDVHLRQMATDVLRVTDPRAEAVRLFPGVVSGRRPTTGFREI